MAMSACRTASWTAAGLFVIGLLTGCGMFDFMNKADQPTTRPAGTISNREAMGQFQGPAFEGTVGSVVYLEGHRPLRVRGFGLVMGLHGQGSRNCPPSIREMIIKEIRRYRSAHPEIQADLPPAEEVLNSLDTAVVSVGGEIPGGAAPKRRFDLLVSAVDPDTKSLAGGYLLPCDLRVYRDEGPAGSIAGKTMAAAQGPIFMNPLASGRADNTTVNPREGQIIGGGSNLQRRDLQLISVIESYATVRQVQDAINQKFPNEKNVADAGSPTNITLRVPPEYQGREGRFLEIVMALPMSKAPMVLEARAKELAGELTLPEAPLNKVALALEGIGVSVLPLIKPLYTHPRRPVSFYAARTGLRLGDRLALDVIIRHAKDERSPQRREAIHELSEARDNLWASAVLRDLLASGDPQIRILAYEALRRAAPDTVLQVTVGKDPDNFLLELVPSDGPPLVYARRSQIRRIALIGGDHMTCLPPLLYAEPGSPVTLSARQQDPVVTVLRKDHEGKIIVGPLKAPMDVPSLIRFLGQKMTRNQQGKVEGLDLDYSVIVGVLYRLSSKKAINADVRWEEPNIEDFLGPLAPVGRPESEL